MPLIEDESVIKSEWEETLNLLLRQSYICIQNNTYVQRKDTKVCSLLYNVILPFIDTIYITCLVLFEVKFNNIAVFYIYYILKHIEKKSVFNYSGTNQNQLV